jgi:hypothetical protein
MNWMTKGFKSSNKAWDQWSLCKRQKAYEWRMIHSNSMFKSIGSNQVGSPVKQAPWHLKGTTPQNRDCSDCSVKCIAQFRRQQGNTDTGTWLGFLRRRNLKFSWNSQRWGKIRWWPRWSMWLCKCTTIGPLFKGTELIPPLRISAMATSSMMWSQLVSHRNGIHVRDWMSGIWWNLTQLVTQRLPEVG